MLTRIQLRDFRCFSSLQVEFSPDRNLFVGANAQGKTSLLEAICVLLRLQSPRITGLNAAVMTTKRGFVLDGHFNRRHLQFYFSPQRKKLALDSVEQKSAKEYLGVARTVWFSNQDIELVSGSSEKRRSFLDFAAIQLDPFYGGHLRNYRKALRSRNHLLKLPRPALSEIRAFHTPLARAGTYLLEARQNLLTRLQPMAETAQAAVTCHAEKLELQYRPAVEVTLAESLEASLEEDLRLRQTTRGPHRDDFTVHLNAISSELASEGQQRTIALSLKLAHASLLESVTGYPPVLLIDDIFGELDPTRRNALMAHLPAGSQQFITTTHLDWMEGSAGSRLGTTFQLANGTITGSSPAQ